MMESPIHVLVCVDDFTPAHIERIESATLGWGRVESFPQSIEPASYQSALKRSEVVIGWPRPEWLPGTGLRFLQIGSSGWDAYQHKGLEGAGIAVCSARGVFTVSAAEHAIAMMLALARNLQVHFRDKQSRRFERHGPYREIAGSTAVVVGLGAIGTGIAERAAALGMNVIGVVNKPGHTHPAVGAVLPLEEAVRQGDHVFVAVPGGTRNVGLLSRAVLEGMKPGAFLYNVSRGTTVDEPALCDLIRSGHLGGAGLDVTAVEPPPPDSPLWELGDQVILTGHSAGVGDGYADRFCSLAIRNLQNYRDGQPLENLVIAP